MNKVNLVKQLRELTQAPMKDCSEALKEANNNFDEAVNILKIKGKTQTLNKSNKIPCEGVVDVCKSGYFHFIFEANCQTDFVANSDDFKKFVDVCKLSLQTNSESMVQDAVNEVVGKTRENCLLRRSFSLTGNVFSYVHFNKKIAVLVKLDKEDKVLGENIAMHVASTNPLFLSIQNIDQSEISKQRTIFEKQTLESGKNYRQEVFDKIVDGKMSKWFTQVCLLEQLFVLDENRTIKDLTNENKIVDFVRYELGEGLNKNNENFAEEVLRLV